MDEIKLPADAADRKIFARCAPAYWAAGLSVIPIRRGSKVPALPAKDDLKDYPAWTEYCRRLPAVEDRETWLRVYDECGIGLALGPASGVVVIDVDTVDPDQIAAIEGVLPASPWRRVGSKGWAAAYKYAGLKPFKIKNDAGETVVEYLAEGNQVVLPPTIHPRTGQPYRANCELLDVLDQLTVLPADIEMRLREALGLRGSQRSKGRQVVMAAPVDRGLDVGADAIEFFGIRLPARCGAGGRDDTCTKVVGSLAAGVVSGRWNLWSAEAALEAWFVAAVEQPAGDELEWSKWPAMLWRFVAASADEAGGRAGFGWREGLTDHELNVRGLDGVRDGDPIGWIARNYIYAAREDAFIEKERGIACPSAELMRKFKHRLPDGAAMLRDDAARDFIRLKAGADLITADYMALRAEMAPGLARDEAGRQFWNLWRGWGAVPRSGDAGPWLDLLRKMFPVSWEREVVEDFLAHLIQRPGERLNWCLALISETRGTGKTTIGEVMLRLFGDAGVLASNEVLAGKFTGWLLDKAFVLVDECHCPDRRSIEVKLRGWITSDRLAHEAKGADAVERPLRANWIITSNHEDFLPIGEGERRYFIPTIAEIVRPAVEWQAFHAWLEAGGVGVILERLMTRQIGVGFRAKGWAPITERFRAITGQGSSLWEIAIVSAMDEFRDVFVRDIVTVGDVVQWLGDRRGLRVSEVAVSGFFRRRGLKALSKRRLKVGGRVINAIPWIVRREAEWLAASDAEIRVEAGRLGVGNLDDENADMGPQVEGLERIVQRLNSLH